MRNIFPDSLFQISVAIQSPAKWMNRMSTISKRAFSPSQIPHISPVKTRWISAISDIVASNPDVQLNVWRDEDAPFLWPRVIREVAGLDFGSKRMGDLDVYSRSTTKEGTQRLRAYFAANPPHSETHRMRVAQAFYERYSGGEREAHDLDILTGNNHIVDDFEGYYSEDCHYISRLPGVNFMSAS